MSDAATLIRNSKCLLCLKRNRLKQVIVQQLYRWAHPACVVPAPWSAIGVLGNGPGSIEISIGLPAPPGPAGEYVLACYSKTPGGPYDDCQLIDATLPNLWITGLDFATTYYIIAYAWNGPTCISAPTIEVSGTTATIPSPGGSEFYLTDEDGNYILDSDGNRIIVTI